MPLPLPGGKKASESRSFLGPFARQNCLRILHPWHFGITRSKSYRPLRHTQPWQPKFSSKIWTHTGRGCHTHAPDSRFSTPHIKNGQNGKLTGDLEESGKAGGGSLKASALKMEKLKKKKLFSSKSSCDHSAPVSFPFWQFFMCGVCYPNPGAPLHTGMFIFVSLRQCSSHLLLSASTHFIVRVLSACVICTLPHLGIILFYIRLVSFFRGLYFSGGVFFVVLSYPVR